MKRNTIIIITFTIILIIVLISIVILYYNNLEEQFNPETDTTYFTCDLVGINDTLKRTFKKNNIKYTSNFTDADLYIPCGYTNAELELQQIKDKNKNKYTYAISGCDQLAGKNFIWNTLINYYGRSKAKTIMPESWILNDFNDTTLFNRTKNSNKLYILKANKQRQEGLKFYDGVSNITSFKNDYVVVQEFLDDPFLIDGRKINLRVYVLIICNNKTRKKCVYMYNDGFIYYTKEKYRYSPDSDYSITTGYISRDIYKTNPLTHSDLKKYIGNNYSSILFKNIENNLKQVMDASVSKLCSNNQSEVSLQTFGADYAINSDLSVFLHEFNKGYSNVKMDKKDGDLKEKLDINILEQAGIIPSKEQTTNFKIINEYSF